MDSGHLGTSVGKKITYLKLTGLLCGHLVNVIVRTSPYYNIYLALLSWVQAVLRSFHISPKE